MAQAFWDLSLPRLTLAGRGGASLRRDASASEQPIPAAGPLTAQTTGTGARRIWLIAGL